MKLEPVLAVRAFHALEAMRRCTSVLELDEVAGRFFRDLGAPWFSLARFFDSDRSPNTKVMSGFFEPGWSERYVQRQYAGSSLIAGQMLRSSRPYSWSDVLRTSAASIDSSEQGRILGEAREHGLRDGYFTPARWLDGSFAAVVVAGWDVDVHDPLARTMLEVLTSYYSHEARRLLVETPLPLTPLSARQRDCLAWVRHGKSSTDIAEMLGISPLTVEEHIKEACRKLGVRTRVQAAVEATLLGLI